MDELFPSMRDIAGFRGADLLRRDDEDEVAFITLTRFDTLDAVRAFAGNEYENPVLEPTARALLSRYDEKAQHFATITFGDGQVLLQHPATFAEFEVDRTRPLRPL